MPEALEGRLLPGVQSIQESVSGERCAHAAQCSAAALPQRFQDSERPVSMIAEYPLTEDRRHTLVRAITADHLNHGGRALKICLAKTSRGHYHHVHMMLTGCLEHFFVVRIPDSEEYSRVTVSARSKFPKNMPQFGIIAAIAYNVCLESIDEARGRCNIRALDKLRHPELARVTDECLTLMNTTAVLDSEGRPFVRTIKNVSNS